VPVVASACDLQDLMKRVWATPTPLSSTEREERSGRVGVFKNLCAVVLQRQSLVWFDVGAERRRLQFNGAAA
jgi:hypothetical protein